MTFFKKVINQVFGGKEDPPVSNEPVLQETIKRPLGEIAAYETWKTSAAKNYATSFIVSQYRSAQNGEENVSVFRVLNSGSSNGFLLRRVDDISAIEFQHLFDYLKEKTLEFDYLPYMSDRRMFNRKDFVETVERHYLKPNWKSNTKAANATGKMYQIFGNINIELFKMNDEPTHLKFLAHHYVDHKYHEPEPFGELVDSFAV
ncbi:MAG: hypothetical protein KDC92_01190 [Bacteroidetes bacterium]|nr:hypothetical protein [Bacteroidota bacterium]